MIHKVLHKSDSRGFADHGWLISRHTFSFAGYYDPERIRFGLLRVLNDDHVEAGKGFDTHPHDNMEIISIPLEGDLEHKDSMGNVSVISSGEIQVMSAGSGITHSEYNKNNDRPVKFLQIWIFPNRRNVTPRYDQIRLDENKMHNRLQQILSPSPDDDGVWIYQDAWFHMGKFKDNISVDYSLKKQGNGVYAFVLEGKFVIEGTELNTRDGMGLWNTNTVSIKSASEVARLLLMEVPMTS